MASKRTSHLLPPLPTHEAVRQQIQLPHNHANFATVDPRMADAFARALGNLTDDSDPQGGECADGSENEEQRP